MGQGNFKVYLETVKGICSGEFLLYLFGSRQIAHVHLPRSYLWIHQWKTYISFFLVFVFVFRVSWLPQKLGTPKPPLLSLAQSGKWSVTAYLKSHMAGWLYFLPLQCPTLLPQVMVVLSHSLSSRRPCSALCPATGIFIDRSKTNWRQSPLVFGHTGSWFN